MSAILLPASRSPRRREPILALAAKRSDLFFFLEEVVVGTHSRSGPLPSLSFLRTNVAVLERADGEGQALRGEGEPGIGALLGWLEAVDFKEGIPFRPFASAPVEPGGKSMPHWLEKSDSLRLQAWRRWEGFRRSLDLGTRWIVFEPNHPFLLRRVEREIIAFLYRLRRQSFLSEIDDDVEFEVACVSSCEERLVPGAEGGRVSIRVRAKLSSPFAEWRSEESGEARGRSKERRGVSLRA